MEMKSILSDNTTLEPIMRVAFSKSGTSQVKNSHAFTVRGVLLTKSPHSRKRTGEFSPSEDEDQEDEVEDERDCEECRMESRREVRTNTAHETWMTRCGQPLEPMSRATLLCVQGNMRNFDV